MSRATAFACLILTAGGSAAQGQERILKGPTCAPCTISVTRVATLGDNERGLVGIQFAGARDAQGRYWISHPESGDEVVIFDASGKYLRTFGRRGDGPGEFRRIRQIVAVGNEIHLFDVRQARATVLSMDFQVKRTFKVVGDPMNVEPLAGGSFIVNTSLPTREKAGLLLHLMNGNGEIERSFGEVESAFRLDYGLAGRREIGAAREMNRFWVVPSTEYVIQKWNTDGAMASSLRRTVDWFEPHKLEIWPHPKTPPAPVVRGVEEDSSGLLTVIASRADAQWYEAVEPDDTWIGGYKWTDDWDRFLDTVIEVIDPATQEVLSSRRVDEYYWSALGGGYYASYDESSTGTPRIHVWRVQFTRSAVGTRDIERLRSLIADRDAAIVLVPERRAVQVIGCGGQVAGHFKVTPDLLASLAE